MQQGKKQAIKQHSKKGKGVKKPAMLPSTFEKRKRRFLTFFGVFFTLGLLFSSVYVIRLVNNNKIPANFQFIISAIKILDVFLLFTAPIYAGLIYYSYLKGSITSKKAFNIRMIFAGILFIYSVAIFFGLR